MAKSLTIAEYLITRLEQTGLKHVFGIPGDYVLGFYDLLSKSSLSVIGTCTEIGAGFAAEAYARLNGLGAVCTTYCVGGFNLINPVAQAYAERTPLIVISGAPGLAERVNSPLLHHRVRDFDTQRLIFERITAAAEALEDPLTARHQIDAAITTCIRKKRPVYLELPRDCVATMCGPPLAPSSVTPNEEPPALREAVNEASAMLRRARRPVLLAGVELHRFGLQDVFLRFAEKNNLPVAVSLLDKSVIAETHPLYLGVYEGAMGREDTRRVVEGADCVMILGAFLTDINMGIFTSTIQPSRTIHATSDLISIQHHFFSGIGLGDFIAELTKCDLGLKHPFPRIKAPTLRTFIPRRGRPLTVRRFFAQLQSILSACDAVVIVDSGDCMFGAADLTIHHQTQFVGSAYYLCMGFAVPAALGVQINKRHLRPIVLVGDGAFQMTCQELSTIIRHKLNPIILVMNNRGYSTQRVIQDGPYNDIYNWSYEKWPLILNGGLGLDVNTEDELKLALDHAIENTSSYTILNVHLDPNDHSEALLRLGKRLKERVHANSVDPQQSRL